MERTQYQGTDSAIYAVKYTLQRLKTASRLFICHRLGAEHNDSLMDRTDDVFYTGDGSTIRGTTQGAACVRYVISGVAKEERFSTDSLRYSVCRTT